MKEYVCKFVGGKMDGQIVPRDVAMECDTMTGLSEDLTEWRNHGAIVHRPELDNQPEFEGYIGPMWDGTTKTFGRDVGVLRYETQEVYDLLSR